MNPSRPHQLHSQESCVCIGLRVYLLVDEDPHFPLKGSLSTGHCCLSRFPTVSTQKFHQPSFTGRLCLNPPGVCCPKRSTKSSTQSVIILAHCFSNHPIPSPFPCRLPPPHLPAPLPLPHTHSLLNERSIPIGPPLCSSQDALSIPSLTLAILLLCLPLHTSPITKIQFKYFLVQKSISNIEWAQSSFFPIIPAIQTISSISSGILCGCGHFKIMDSGRQKYDFIFLPFALIPFWTHISIYRRKVSFTNAGKIMSLPVSHLNLSVNSGYFSVPSFLSSTWAGSTPGRLMFHTASGGILFRSDCTLFWCPLNRGWHLLVFAHWSLDPCISFSIHWATMISALGHVWSISQLEMPFHCLLPSLAKNKGLGHVEKSVMLFLMTCRVYL